MDGRNRILKRGVIGGVVAGSLWGIDLVLCALLTALPVKFLLPIISMGILSFVWKNKRAKYIFFEVLISIIPILMTFLSVSSLSFELFFCYAPQACLDIVPCGGSGDIESAIFMTFTLLATFLAYFIERRKNKGPNMFFRKN